MAFALRCPDCRKAFRWEPLKKMPRYCPLCEADMGEEKDDTVISIPAFLSARTKANDKVYRDTERASEHRVEQAAQAAGVSPSDMSDLKITNMREARHAGEIAAMPVNNAVTQQMEMMQQRGVNVGFGAAPNVEGFKDGVKSGPYPNAGANVIRNIQRANGNG